MWFFTENNAIVSGPVTLPGLWADSEGTQHPLRELEKKGHVSDLISMGWLPQNIQPAAAGKYQKVTGYSHVINGSQVDSAPVVVDLPIEDRRQIRLDEIRTEGYSLIDQGAGDERSKLRIMMKSIVALDDHARRNNNRGPELDALVTQAEMIEQIHLVIDQAEVDLATHTDPAGYNVVWPS